VRDSLVEVVVALALALIVAACGSSEDSAEGSVGRAEDDTFLVQIVSPKDHYSVGEAIPITSTIMYMGRQISITASGEAPGLITYDVDQLDGPLDMLGGTRLMCHAHRLDAGRAYEVPFTKSGGFDDAAPNAGFWKAYFADRQLHLPVGSWKITAVFRAVPEAGCAGKIHVLNPSVSFSVE
jgi:hypothetical protein